MLDGEPDIKEGVPHIVIDTTSMEINAIGRFLLDEEKLPSVEEVTIHKIN